jgi:glycosyltransferase involved in cell wall biosynthesis
MSDRFSIDIIICTFNNAGLLKQTLNALAGQRVSHSISWNVSVVNNNCTDNTAEVVSDFQQSTSLSLSMVVETRQGLTPARLCGVRNSSGDWIAFVDDDCLLAEDWIEEAARFAAEHPQCGAFGGKIILDWEEPPPQFVVNRRYAYAGKRFGDTPQMRSWLAGAGMILRRSALEQSGWVEKQLLEDRIGQVLVSGGDVEIGMRIAAHAEVWYTPTLKLHHVIPSRRMTREYLRRMVFGLGASRHNVAALTWNGSYLSWLLYSIVYAFGFALFGVAESVREAVWSGDGLDLKLGLGPARGWWAAVRSMWRMKTQERQSLLGALAKKPKPDHAFATVTVSSN